MFPSPQDRKRVFPVSQSARAREPSHSRAAALTFDLMETTERMALSHPHTQVESTRAVVLRRPSSSVNNTRMGKFGNHELLISFYVLLCLPLLGPKHRFYSIFFLFSFILFDSILFIHKNVFFLSLCVPVVCLYNIYKRNSAAV